MRVLILGAAGMLGHKLCQSYRSRYETWATVRSSPQSYFPYNLLDEKHLIGGVDGTNFETIIEALAQVKPDVVINCIGIIKQLPTAKNPSVSISINSLLPHKLSMLCQAAGARFFHMSTDCVFNGKKGMYTEDDPSDAEDLYGRSKFLGEVNAEGCITIRSSIIGRELNTISGLVEWFLSNHGKKVRGFTHAIYSGFTTLVMADIMANLIDNHPHLSGVWQVSSAPINKYDLLVMVRDAYGVNIEIEPYPDMVIDRSLDSQRFRTVTGFVPPSWETMIEAMAKDNTQYDEWRR
jgi:dTDP-4-dehydrorhamnose reductase